MWTTHLFINLFPPYSIRLTRWWDSAPPLFVRLYKYRIKLKYMEYNRELYNTDRKVWTEHPANPKNTCTLKEFSATNVGTFCFVITSIVCSINRTLTSMFILFIAHGWQMREKASSGWLMLQKAFVFKYKSIWNIKLGVPDLIN